MKKIIILATLLAFSAIMDAAAQNGVQQEQRSLEEVVAEQADKLGKSLVLEDWQIYYVDSILLHNMGAIQKDVEALGNSKTIGRDIYQNIQDEWMAKTDEAFEQLFTEIQWKRYLRSGALREMKARERRQKEREKADAAIRALKESGELD